MQLWTIQVKYICLYIAYCIAIMSLVKTHGYLTPVFNFFQKGLETDGQTDRHAGRQEGRHIKQTI